MYGWEDLSHPLNQRLKQRFAARRFLTSRTLRLARTSRGALCRTFAILSKREHEPASRAVARGLI